MYIEFLFLIGYIVLFSNRTGGKILREEFIKKGGQVVRKALHYMVVEHSPWLSSWYDNMAYIKIPIEEFNVHTLSFTYGDSHPTFSSRVNDGKEYRKNCTLMRRYLV